MSQRDANWIDGIRGIVSFMVVTGHVCTSFFPDFHSPAPDTGKPALFQLPFLRLLVGGRTAVAMFFIITGYVNSYGTLTRAKSGNTDVAFNSLARSALTRASRLILPTIIATFIAWLLAQLNAFKMSEHVDATWIRQGYIAPSPSFTAAIYDLWCSEFSTWTTGWNVYDGTQWTLVMFVEGSMLVYVILLATMLVKPRVRRLIFVAMYLYGWICPDLNTTVKTMNIMIGMILADLHVELDRNATSCVPRFLPPVLLLLGLFCAGYPQQSYERMTWSNVMFKLMTAIVPAKADTRRYWDSIAATLIIFSAFLSARFRRVLTNRVFNFFGRVSFPVYLLHNQMIKSLLVWLVYFPSYFNPVIGDNGNKKDLVRAPLVHLLVALAVFYYIMYWLALLWVRFIDPLIGKLVKSATTYALDLSSSPIEKSITAAAVAAATSPTLASATPASDPNRLA